MALVHSRIGRVFYGCRDEQDGALGAKYSLNTQPLINHRFEVCWCATRSLPGVSLVAQRAAAAGGLLMKRACCQVFRGICEDECAQAGSNSGPEAPPDENSTELQHKAVDSYQRAAAS